MKKIISTTMMFAMIIASLTSCSMVSNSDQPPMPNPEELADATIIWYGTGGGNRDDEILTNFRQFYHAKSETYDHVNIVAQYKASGSLYSKFNEYDYEEINELKEKTDEELEKMLGLGNQYLYLSNVQPGATYRFALDSKKTLHRQLIETEPYGENNCDFTCPDSLTNFINWAATHYPAKKYILVMADHGGGYFFPEELPEYAMTRGMLYDDGHDKKCFSAKSFAKGLKNAKVRLDGIVFYLCLMNNIEFLYEVKDLTDYTVGSTYTLWALGGALESLADNMASGLDTKEALANFVDANVDSWDREEVFYATPGKPHYFDLTLTETCRLNDLTPVLKEFTDRLVDTYQNGTPEQRARIDECTANAVKVHASYPFYDFAKYMEVCFMKLPDVFDEELYQRLQTSFNACLVKQRYAKPLTEHNYQVDYSVNLGVKGRILKYTNLDMRQAVLAYCPDGTLEVYKRRDPGETQSGLLDDFDLIESSTWGSTFADTYQQSTFDKLVGWSRWLLINESAPPAWSPSSSKYDLPEDDMSVIPTL